MILFDLCEDELFQATAPFNGNYDQYVLSGPEFAGLGPSTQDIVVHAEGSNFTSGFTYDVQLQYRFKNGPWAATALLGAQTNGDYVIAAPFTDRSKLGITTRVVLRTQLASGSSNTQHGNLTISVAVRLFSS